MLTSTGLQLPSYNITALGTSFSAGDPIFAYRYPNIKVWGPTSAYNASLFNTSKYSALIFTSIYKMSISSIVLALWKSGSPTGNIELRIETVSGGSPTGTLVNANATQTYNVASLGTSGLYMPNITFTFPSTITLTAGTSYALVLKTAGITFSGGSITYCAAMTQGFIGVFSSMFSSTQETTNGGASWSSVSRFPSFTINMAKSLSYTSKILIPGTPLIYVDCLGIAQEHISSGNTGKVKPMIGGTTDKFGTTTAGVLNIENGAYKPFAIGLDGSKRKILHDSDELIKCRNYHMSGDLYVYLSASAYTDIVQRVILGYPMDIHGTISQASNFASASNSPASLLYITNLDNNNILVNSLHTNTSISGASYDMGAIYCGAGYSSGWYDISNSINNYTAYDIMYGGLCGNASGNSMALSLDAHYTI